SLTEALPNGYRLSDGCAWARDLVDCVHEHAELHLRIELKRFRRLKEVHVMGTRAEAVRQGLMDVGEIGGPRLGIGHGEVAPVLRLPARDGIPPAIRQYVLGSLVRHSFLRPSIDRARYLCRRRRRAWDV